MATALQEWRRHRVDYRFPTLAALLLFASLGLLLPRNWLDLPWLGTPSTHSTPPERVFHFAEGEGLQILDLEVLGSAPRTAPQPRELPERVEPTGKPESFPQELPGRGEFGWDPTRAYRGGEELLIPESRARRPGVDERLRRLEFLLSLDGVASYSLSDTSHAALAQSNFSRLQREIFTQQAPIWAYEKAVERYRELYQRMIHDDPLRGPQ